MWAFYGLLLVIGVWVLQAYVGIKKEGYTGDGFTRARPVEAYDKTFRRP